LSRYRDGGGGALIHRSRGRPAINRLGAGVQEYVLGLVRQNFRDFGPTLAAEALLERHGVEISRETLRKWMVGDGLWLSRKQRRSFHQPRLRRESYGELVQIDGSDHRWFEDHGEPCTLLVFIDDATSKLMQLRFVPGESTDSYFQALQGYLEAHGCPVAFYSDKHTVFRVNKPDTSGGSGMTQFGRALAELNIEILCANSSQAQGTGRASQSHSPGPPGQRAATSWHLRYGSWQRLPAGVPGALQRVLRRACSEAREPAPLSPFKASQLTDILCHREQRHVGQQLTLAYDRKQIILERSEVSEKLAGQYVEIFDFSDRPLEVRWKGYSLPYRVFSKDQRVSHTAVVENKRLGHALAVVKAQQDVKHQPKIRTNSEKLGYQKRGRQLYGPDYKAKIVAPPAVEMTVCWKAWKTGP